MDRKSRVNSLILGVAVAVLSLVTADTAADDGVHFVYEFSDGHTQQYKVNFKQEMFWGTFSQSAIIDMEVTEKCVGATEDGGFKMEIVFDKVEASVMMFDRMQETGIGDQRDSHPLPAPAWLLWCPGSRRSPAR